MIYLNGSVQIDSLNAGKTKYIVIRPKHLRDDLTRRNLMIKDTMLTRIGNDCDEKSTKFLGILFDDNLTWRDHVSHVNKKISRALFSIKQVINTLPVECLRTLYYSLVHSHLTYGLIVWGNATQYILHQTQMLQKGAIRVANNAMYNCHTDPLFRASAVMKLHDILEYQEALFVFDFMRNKLPMSFGETFTFNKNVPNARLTRQSDLLHIPRCRSHFADKLPLFAVANNWNKWVQKVALNTSRSHFKRQLRMKIFDNYPKQIKCNNNMTTILRSKSSYNNYYNVYTICDIMYYPKPITWIHFRTSDISFHSNLLSNSAK